MGDGSPRPAPARDPELYYQPSTVPGSRLPHCWVGDATHRVSTHDLAPYGRFTLLTGVNGAAGWTAAATAAADRLGIDVACVAIGPGRRFTDLYFDWAALREVDDDGVVLVRPDKHVGWRSRSLPTDPAAALIDALSNVLAVG